MIETRDGRMKSIVGFHNTGVGTAFTKAENGAPTPRNNRQQSVAVGSAAETMKKKYENVTLRAPDKGYSFKCEGEFGNNRDVRWKAEYSKPLEYIMYPSLSMANASGEIQLPPTKDKTRPVNSTGNFDKYAVEEGNGAAVDADIQWKATVTKKAHVSVKKTTLLQEIETVGEAVLRKKLKENYEKLQEAIAAGGVKTENELLGIGPKKKGKRLENLIHALSNDPSRLQAKLSAEDLYTQLRQSAKPDHSSEIARASHKKVDRNILTDTSYVNQKAFLTATMGEDNAHLVEGVLYYRLRNELAIVDRTEKNLEIKNTPIHLTTNHLQRRRTQLLNRVETRQANVLQHPSLATHFQAVAAVSRLHEAMEFAESDYDHQVHEHIRQQSPHDMSRIGQAISARNYGYDSQFNVMEGDDHSPKRGGGAGGRHQKHYDHNHKEITHRNVNLEQLKRDAQDELLLKSLEAGIIPEDFLQRCSRNTSYFDIDLADYGIGDERGLCLGPCLDKLKNISTLGLRGNRLTKVSIPTILYSIPYRHLITLDLSRNNLQRCAEDLMRFLMKEPIIQVLDLSFCGLNCQDIVTIFTPLMQVNSNLQDLDLSNNKIELLGVNVISNILEKSYCTLESVSLAWNNVGGEGARMLANALAVNSSLSCLDLSCTNVGDEGGQRLAFSLGANRSMQVLKLAQNNLKDSSCFVFSMTLPKHPKMAAVDLCSNPLGEIGARSIFRTILNETARGGFRPLISMRCCTYAIDDSIFNHSYPEMDSPYTLDMAKPYDVAILMELLTMTINEPGVCKADSIIYREIGSSIEQPITLSVNSQNKLVSKSTGMPWSPPTSGTIRVHFSKSTAMPTMDKKIPVEALKVLEKIILLASTDADRRKFLECMWTDMYCTTKQAQGMIDRFQSKEMKKIISPGGLSVQDVLICLWSNILDAENKFDFFCRNIPTEARKDFIYELSFPKFKFNWVNPTSFWRLDLSNRAQRVVMRSIVCINHIESENSKKNGRSDTSQRGNYFNFRNERYAPPGEHMQEFEFTAAFLAKLPTSGIVEFDYVSTTRPIFDYKRRGHPHPHAHGAATAAGVPAHLTPGAAGGGHHGHDLNQLSVASLDMSSDIHDNSLLFDHESHEIGGFQREDSMSLEDMSLMDNLSQSLDSQSLHTASQLTSSVVFASGGESATARALHQHDVHGEDDSSIKSSPFYGRALTDEEFDNFMKQLELDIGIRLSKPKSIYKLLELQIAASKYYFTVQRVLKIMDVMSDDRMTQARVVVCMFSRIIDLHRFDNIMRHLEQPTREEVLNSVGPLNCFNALKPGGDYIVALKHRDCRLLVLIMLSIAECESNPLTKDKQSDMAMVDVYTHKSRLLDTTTLQSLVLRFTYNDFSEQQASPKEREDLNWDFRRSIITQTLLGSKPLDREQFRIISMYKEMDKHNTLSTGPVETQYLNHMKSKGNRRHLLEAQQAQLAANTHSNATAAAGGAPV